MCVRVCACHGCWLLFRSCWNQAQYDAESLLTHRDKVSKEIRDSMNTRAAEFNLRLDDVSIVRTATEISGGGGVRDTHVVDHDSVLCVCVSRFFAPLQTHLQFSNEFASAIEKKQVAQQDAERFKFVVMKSEQERLAAIIKAQSEADAAVLCFSHFFRIRISFVMHGSDCRDQQRTMVLQTVLVMNLFSSLVPPRTRDDHPFHAPRTCSNESQDLVSKAFRQSGSALIEMRRLEAAQEIAENLR